VNLTSATGHFSCSAAGCLTRPDCNAPDRRGLHDFLAYHHQTREHGQPKGKAAQNRRCSKARFKAAAHKVKKSGTGALEGAKTEGDRREGRDHGGKYEAHKSASDFNIQANCPAGAPERCRIKKEGTGLESDDLDDELRDCATCRREPGSAFYPIERMAANAGLQRE
jgi:hypothetical protein